MAEEVTSAGREPLADDLKSIIADAEELLKATASATGERILAARTRAEASLRSARERLANLDDVALAQVKEVAKGADDTSTSTRGARWASPPWPACCWAC